jgi:cellulose biosynthesis protein BcsQ
LIIEVKSPKKTISFSSWQLNEYLRRSGSIFGLLTNGKQFKIFYNYCNTVGEILDLSDTQLTAEPDLFYALLSKKSCDRVMGFFETSHRRIHDHIVRCLTPRLPNPELLTILTQTSPDAIVHALERKPAMIITVFNNKGGVGKTTLTINLAAALYKLGKRVLLIDIDPQANLTTGLGVDPLDDVEKFGKKDITHLLIEAKTTLEDVLIKKVWTNLALDLVPSHIRLSDMEPTLNTMIDVDRILARKLKKYQDAYDYILIDPPPSFGRVNSISLMASAAVLIPTQLSPYPIRALEYVMNRVFQVDASREDSLKILGIAVSMYNRTATKLKDDMCAEIYNVLNKEPERKAIELFPEKTWIPQLNIVSTTPFKGQPISEAEFDSTLSQREKETAADAFSCYTALAKHLLTQESQDTFPGA